MEGTQQATETTATDLGWLLDAGDGAVVTLIAGDTRLVAHRQVLMDRSPVFDVMFQHDMLEASTGSVTIPDVEGPVLRLLLSFVYTLQVPQMPGVAPQLLAAADKYGVSALKDACEQQVAAQLSLETAAAAAVLAIRHSCSSLREAALSYIKSHLVEVMATEGWADAVRRQHEDVVELSRLLSETSEPSPEDSGSSPSSAAQPPSNHSQTPGSAAPATAASSHAPPPDDDAVSHLRTPPPAASGSSPSSTAEPPTDHSQMPASAAPATAASSHAPPPDDDAVSRLRSLSPREKDMRLIQAAKQGAVGELEELLAAGADVAARDGNDDTALHCAAARGHVEAARRLLAAGAAVDARGGSWLQRTPLHCAAYGGHAAAVRLLLAARAYPSARNGVGNTPLHWAALRGHAQAAAALLEGGADRRARNNDGHTPLDLATQKKHRQLVELLQQR